MKTNASDCIVYSETDLKTLAPIIDAAKAMVREDAAGAKDEGTCVLDAGIAIYCQRPRRRSPDMRVIIEAPLQGNVGSHRACTRALAFLHAQGIDAFWYDGTMD